MTVFQLARLRLVDLQARYLELLPRPYRNSAEFRTQVWELESLSRDQLVSHILAGQRL